MNRIVFTGALCWSLLSASCGADSARDSASAASGGVGGSTASGGASNGGTAGAPSNGGAAAGSSNRPLDLPPSDSQADLVSFIRAGAYRNDPWISETDAPRAGKIASQHIDNVRVWMNPTLAESLRAGKDGRMGHPYPEPWSMAVKELYDPSTAELVGATAMLKTAPGTTPESWIYFCYGPEPRCLNARNPTLDAPLYGNGATSPLTNCAICHGNSVFSTPP